MHSNKIESQEGKEGGNNPRNHEMKIFPTKNLSSVANPTTEDHTLLPHFNQLVSLTLRSLPPPSDLFCSFGHLDFSNTLFLNRNSQANLSSGIHLAPFSYLPSLLTQPSILSSLSSFQVENQHSLPPIPPEIHKQESTNHTVVSLIQRRFRLVEEPNHQQRRSFIREQRYIRPSPLVDSIVLQYSSEFRFLSLCSKIRFFARIW